MTTQHCPRCRMDRPATDFPMRRHPSLGVYRRGVTCKYCQRRVSAYLEYQPTREEIAAHCMSFRDSKVNHGRADQTVSLVCPMCQEQYGTCDCLTASCETPQPIRLPSCDMREAFEKHTHRVLSRNARRLG